MILPIVRYGHPALRQKGARIERVTAPIRQLVTDMLDTMYDAHGIGLAAQQVGRALQLAILDVRGVQDRPSSLEIDGKEAEVAALMPLVLINPEIKTEGEWVTGPEGCLSFPEMFSEISRPASVEVRAQGLDGRRLLFRCGGLLCKAIQHEVDHLNGILFIDRMSKTAKTEMKAELEALMAETKAELDAQSPRDEAAKDRR